MEPNGRKRTTLAAIAAAAGTSVPTVSKVLRGATDVSDSTRQKVMQAAHDLGYSKTRGDRELGASTYQPTLVDLVVSNIEGTWANRVLSGVERAATDAGSDVVITSARPGRDWVTRLLRRPSAGAIILLVDATPVQLGALRAGGIPLVLIDPMSTPPADIASVGVTNWEGGRSAAEHLLALGHRRLGVIGGNRTHMYSNARIDGFRSAASDAGVSVSNEFIGHGDWSRASGHTLALRFLRNAERPSAIFACSDLMALGVYDAARELGLAIPADLSVVGFDDVPESEWAAPPLTTVQQPIIEMGAAALRMLLRVGGAPTSASGARAAPREELATGLQLRDSTRAVNG